MDIKVLISDRDFNEIEEVQHKIRNVRWDYNRIGGCGSFQFDIPIRYCTETSLGGNFNVKIYRRDPSDGSYDLWFQGRIENKIHNVRGNDEIISIKGNGYQSQLADIYIDEDYSSKTIEYIVEDIIDNHIVGNTDITKGTISATGFTVDSYSINTDALSAIQDLADIVGSREWGVDANREFFFKARSTSTGFRYPLGRKITDFSVDNSSTDIVNRVIVQGDGTFTRTVNDAKSQLKWGRRDKVYQNSAITTNTVADQLAAAVLADFDDVVQKVRLKLLDEVRIEETIPIPLFEVITREITYDEIEYDKFLYAGQPAFQIERASYNYGDNGDLEINLQMGKIRSSLAEDISQIEYRLDQLRQKGV